MLDGYRRALVTGGAGFIGSHICEELLSYGKKVVIVDNLSTGRQENIPPGTEFLELDVTDRAGMQRALKDVDLIFHVAAQPSARASVEDPRLDFESNVRGTYNLLTAALEANVKKLIYTSSSAVYGEPKHLPLDEKHVPDPSTPYGTSKLCGERYCIVFSRIYGLPCTCLRPFNVYGPRENPETSLDEVALYTRAVLKKQPITIYGDGNQTRDFVYVKDVAHAHILAAEHDASIGQVLNIGTGSEISINRLVQKIEETTGSKAMAQFEPWPPGDIYREFANNRLAEAMIGYSPVTILREGIGELVRFLG